eukprot:scaffold1651_cov317-Pinguiococcus_pyrenoidosus.AAC.19
MKIPASLAKLDGRAEAGMVHCQHRPERNVCTISVATPERFNSTKTTTSTRISFIDRTVFLTPLLGGLESAAFESSSALADALSFDVPYAGTTVSFLINFTTGSLLSRFPSCSRTSVAEMMQRMARLQIAAPNTRNTPTKEYEWKTP